MSTIAFSGLSTGLDTVSLITQLVAASKQPATTLGTQQTALASRKSIVDSIASSVAALGTLADGMTKSSDLQFRAATSSDAHVSLAVSGAAAATTHAIRVDQTARAQVTSSRTFSSAAAGVLGAGSLQLTTGATSATIAWTSADSLATIASRINDAKAGATASVLFDGTSYRLMMSSSATGAVNATAFVDTGDGLALSDPANVKVAARDAVIQIDGTTITRPTNVIDDALTGVTITAVSAHAPTDTDASISIALDRTALKAKTDAFISAYNKISNAINGQLDYAGTTKGASTLAGDSTLRQLQTKLRGLTSQMFGSVTLSQIGISTDKTGVMSLDATKFDAALGKNPDVLADVFSTGGLANGLRDLRDTYTRASDGVLTSKSKGFTTRSADLQKQIDQINTNAASLQTRLQAQFDSLEATMSKLSSQSSYINKMFG